MFPRSQSSMPHQQNQMQPAQQLPATNPQQQQQQHISGVFAGNMNQATNHALQDYQMQFMLLEQQNKKRLMMARQEQQQNTTPSSSNPPAVFGSSSSVTPPVVGTSGPYYPATGHSIIGHSSPMNSSAPPGGMDFSTGAKSNDVLADFDFDSFLNQPEDTSEDLIDYSDEEDDRADAAALESASGPEDTPMSTLFSEQTFIGNWDWSPRLEAIVGVTQSAALADIKLPGHYSQLQLVLATLCAVAFLKNKLADEKDVWELIVEKAEDWLRGQTQEDVMELEKIVEGALFANDAA